MIPELGLLHGKFPFRVPSALMDPAGARYIAYEHNCPSPVGQRALPVRKSDFGWIFSWMKIQRNNLLFLIFTGKKIRFFGFA